MIFEYEFMRRAFIVGILLALVVPCIGVTIVLKRMSMIGDALSHVSLAGVALGLIGGFNPILGATFACVFAAFGIDSIKKKFKKYSEVSVAIIMSTGIGLAGILSEYVPNVATFNSFLFGSIVAITDFELYLVIIISFIVLFSFIFFYKELFILAFDEQCAKFKGVKVGRINFVFTLLTAITVSIAARTVGALIVSSMMVIPVTCAIKVAKSYKQTVCFSILFDLFFTVFGLTVSYFLGLKPGGTIVIIGVLTLILILNIKVIDKSRVLH